MLKSALLALCLTFAVTSVTVAQSRLSVGGEADFPLSVDINGVSLTPTPKAHFGLLARAELAVDPMANIGVQLTYRPTTRDFMPVMIPEGAFVLHGRTLRAEPYIGVTGGAEIALADALQGPVWVTMRPSPTVSPFVGLRSRHTGLFGEVALRWAALQHHVVEQTRSTDITATVWEIGVRAGLVL